MTITESMLKFFLGGRRVRQESFSCIVSVAVAVAASAADIVFRSFALTGAFEYDTAGYGALFIASGVVTAVGALGTSAILLVARTGRMGSLPLSLSVGVTSVGYLLNMLFALLVRGSAHMSIEVLLFVFSLVALLAIILTSVRTVIPLKSAIVMGAMCVLSVIAAFIPYFTGDFSIAESAGCLPLSALLGAAAFAVISLSAGDDGKEENFERQ